MDVYVSTARLVRCVGYANSYGDTIDALSTTAAFVDVIIRLHLGLVSPNFRQSGSLIEAFRITRTSRSFISADIHCLSRKKIIRLVY